MPTQTDYSLETIRNIRTVQNGDGSVSLAVSLVGSDGSQVSMVNGQVLAIVGGRTVVKNGEFTRPSNTTAYTIGDVVCNSTSAPTIMTFQNVARVANGSGVIIGAELIVSSNQTTKGVFNLFLFDTTVGIDNDNSPFTPTDAEMKTKIAVIPFSTATAGDITAGAGGNCTYEADTTNKGFVCTGGGTSIFGVLVAANAYTPTADEVFTIRLVVAQD